MKLDACIKVLTVQRDVDVVEADVHAQFGNDLLSGEGPVGARDLLFGRVPLRAVAAHCSSKARLVSIIAFFDAAIAY